MKVEFDDTVEGMRKMAAFVAQLVREAVTFKVTFSSAETYVVELTGGF